MKIKTIFPLLLSAGILNFACRNINTVEPKVDKEDRGQGIFVNMSTERPIGIDTLFINEGDTLDLVVSSVLPAKPRYSWKSFDESILKIVANPDSHALATAIALGTKGAQTAFVLEDSANEAQKTVPVKIEKFWADPLYFSYMGELAGHHYYLSYQKMFWTQCREFCEKANGHLVTITSTDESNFLIDNRNPMVENNWIGLTFLFGNRNLSHWITGEPVTYTNWVSGKPTDPGIFAEYYFYMQANGKWENWHEIAYNFILEME